MKNLWMDERKSRFFLIPGDKDLEPGEFVISMGDGMTRNVATSFLAPFEVKENVAKAHIQAGLAYLFEPFHELIQNAKGEDLDRVITQDLPVGDSSPGGSDPLHIEGEVDAANEAIRQLFGGLIQILGNSMSQDKSQSAESRRQMRALRKKLRKQGLKLETDLESLPDRLQKQYSTMQAPDLSGFASSLRQAADLLENISEETNLDDVVELLSSSFSGVLGMDDEEERYWEEKSREFSESASDAIARSLKAHGITPLASKEKSSGSDQE